MPLVSIIPELKKAQAGQYAIPLFDSFEMKGFEGTLAALEQNRSPGIIGILPLTINKPEGRAFVRYIRARAENSPVPVSIMLDHGESFEQCIQILDYGATDVMFDGGQLPMAENIEITRMIVRAAHTMGAGVEAELGWVGAGSDYEDPEKVRQGFTKPEEAERFVEKTGVDALAVAIGSAHGVYKGEPQLALDLLAEIRKRVDVPLVLHGGSGLADNQFQAAIKGGISKINIFTNLGLAAGKRMAETANAENSSYFSIGSAAKKAFAEGCRGFINVFGSTGKA